VSAPSRAFTPLDFAQLMLVALIWGVTSVFAKISVDAFPAMMAAALRFALASAVLIFFVRPPPPGQWRPFLLVLLVMGPVHFGFQYVGLKLAEEVSPMLIAMQLWAPSSVLFAALLLKETVGPLRWIGVATAFVGLAWMNFDPAVFAQMEALILVTISACAYGLGTVLVRRIAGAVGPWSMQGWIALAVTVSMTLGSLTLESGHVEAARSANWGAWAAILYSGLISSIVASALLFRLVQRYEVSRTTPYLLLSPVLAFILAQVMLDEQMTPQMVIGAALTMVGVVLVVIAERRFKAVA
jgi:O-acetylserine/cysteine efflux transporter